MEILIFIEFLLRALIRIYLKVYFLLNYMNKIVFLMYKNRSNIILLLFSVILAFLFIEIANYLFYSGDYYVWPPYLNEVFLPNSSIMSGITGASFFTINELGYRGPLIKDKDKEYRILTMGGSTTEELYLDDNETWPYLLMKNLNMTNDGRQIIAMNIGKSGHNTRDHIIQLKSLIPLYKPDLVILMVGANDMLLKLSKRWVWKPFDENTYDYTKSFSYISDYSFKSSISYKIYNMLSWELDSQFKEQDVVGDSIMESRLERKNSKSIINEIPDLALALDDYEGNLGRLIEIAQENNVSVIFSTQPFLWKENMSKEEDSSLWMTTDFNGNFYPVKTMSDSMEKFNLRLLSFCAKNKKTVCFDLERKVPKSLNYFYDDMHFNENGAEFVAEQFARYFKDHHL